MKRFQILIMWSILPIALTVLLCNSLFAADVEINSMFNYEITKRFFRINNDSVFITWNTDLFTANISIDFTNDGGSTWINILNDNANNGNFNWFPKDDSYCGSPCYIRIYETSHLSIRATKKPRAD